MYDRDHESDMRRAKPRYAKSHAHEMDVERKIGVDAERCREHSRPRQY